MEVPNTGQVKRPSETEFDNSKSGWSNSPKVEDLKRELTTAMSDNAAALGKIEKWVSLKNVTGKYKIKKRQGRSALVPKLVRKQMEWQYATLSEPFNETEDMFTAEGVTAEDVKAAEQNTLVLNSQFRNSIPKIKLLDSIAHNVVDTGVSILRVGWHKEVRTVKEEIPQYTYTAEPNNRQLKEYYASIATAMQNGELDMEEEPIDPSILRGLAKTMDTGQVYSAKLTSYKVNEVEKVVKNHPTLVTVPYDKVIIDPDCDGDISKAKFVAVQFKASIRELRTYPVYKNLDSIVVSVSDSSNSAHNEQGESSYNHQLSDDRKLMDVTEYWGYHNVDGGKEFKAIVISWIGETTIREGYNPFPDELPPFVSIQGLYVEGSVYGESNAELLEDSQLINSALVRSSLDIIGRAANAQVGSQKGSLDYSNRLKFNAGQSYEYNAGTHPDQVFHMHKHPEVPQSALLMMEAQKTEAEGLSGVQSFDRGISGKNLGDSATSVMGALDAASERKMTLLRRIAVGLEEAGRKIIGMNAVFLEENSVVRITANEFVPIRRDDLLGSIDLKLKVSTPEYDNDKASRLEFVIQTLGASLSPEMVKYIMAEMFKLRKLPHLAKQMEEYDPQPDPIEQEKAMLEVELLKAELALKQSEADALAAKAQLDMAKAQQARSGSRQSESAADAADLDYIQKADGTDHQRGMEATQNKVAGEAALKRAEHESKMAQIQEAGKQKETADKAKAKKK